MSFVSSAVLYFWTKAFSYSGVACAEMLRVNNSEKIAMNDFIISRQLGDEIGNGKSFFSGLILDSPIDR
jgi:hypothetical protein